MMLFLWKQLGFPIMQNTLISRACLQPRKSSQAVNVSKIINMPSFDWSLHELARKYSPKEKRMFFIMGMNSMIGECVTWTMKLLECDCWSTDDLTEKLKTGFLLIMQIVAVGKSDSLFKSKSFSSQFLCRPEPRKFKVRDILRRTFKLSHLHNWFDRQLRKNSNRAVVQKWGHRETGKSWLVTVRSCSFTVSCFGNKQFAQITSLVVFQGPTQGQSAWFSYCRCYHNWLL